jgi:diguanylate cyclase (GGDEF)-like protein/PAS domain S-box-containing protein
MSRRTFFLALALVGATVPLHASAGAQDTPDKPGGQTRTIGQAIAQRRIDQDVTIAGRAIVSSGKLQSSAFDVAIEDASGGIRIFSRGQQPDVREGDSVVATGRIQSYRGNLELAAGRVSVIEGPRRTVVPLELPIEQTIIAQHTGQLIRVHGRVAGAGHSEGGQWLRLRDAASTAHGTLTIWVPANHGAPIDLARVGSQDSIVVSGIVTSYQDNADDPVVWQLVPRDAGDVQIGAVPAVLPPWVLWTALAVAVAAGTILVVSRISSKRQLRALRETESRYRQLLALLPDAVIVHARGEILFANPASAELLGLPSEQALIGQPLANFVQADSRSTLAEETVDHSMTGTTRAPRERARMLNKSGTVVDVEVTSSPCLYHDRPAMVLLARDITAQLRYERDLHALALVDELTGLQNRRAFTLFAEQELGRARRNGNTPVLVFADLDGLKKINDEHGHAAGDAAIRLVANALKSIFRETDIVARWSGDEFVALMGEGSEEAASLIGGRLDQAIAVLTPRTLPYIVSASVGASPLDPELPLRDAMERADAELYEQKKRGRRSKIRPTPISIDAIKQPN